ncbi:224_t:CDS:1, partial [Funneliformis caledonium]
DNNNELSDYHNSDDNWYDNELEDSLNQILQTIFNVMIENAKNLSAFTNNHLLVYIKNSERT